MAPHQIKNIISNNVIQAPAEQQGSVGTPVAAKPEVVPVGQNSGQDSALVAYIKTLLNLPNDEILKNVKEQFNDVDDATLKATIAQVKIAAGENGNGENHEITMNAKEPGDLGATTIKSDVAKENGVMTAGAEEIEDTSNLSEEEILLNNYAEQLKKSSKDKVEIDDVVKHLKDIPADKLTEDEKKILEYIDNLKAAAKKEITRKDIMNIMREHSEDFENLIPKEVKESVEWNNKTVIEKLDARADALLEKRFPGYSKLPEGSSKAGEEEPGTKAYLRKEFYSKVGEILFDGTQKTPKKNSGAPNKKWDEFTDTEKRYEMQMIAVAIDAAEQSGEPLSKLLDPVNGKELMHEIISKYGMDNIMTKFTQGSVTDSKEWKELEQNGRSGIEQIKMVADEIIKGLDKEYNSLPNAEKKEIRNKWIDNIARQLYPNWDSLKYHDKEVRSVLFAKELCVIKEIDGMKPSDYFALSYDRRLECIEAYENAHGIVLTDEGRLERATLKRLVREGKLKGEDVGLSVTIDQKIETLELRRRNAKDGKLSPNDQRTYDILCKIREFNIKGQELNEEETVEYALNNLYKDIPKDQRIKRFLEDVLLKGRKISDIPDDEIKEILNSCRSFDLAAKLCKDLGVDPRKYLGPRHNAEMAATGIVDGDINLAVQANKGFVATGHDDLVKVTNRGVVGSMACRKHMLDYMEATANLGNKYLDNLGECMDDRTLISFKDSTNYATQFAKSNNVPDSSKSILAQSLVCHAQNDTERLGYSKALSQTGNAATLEGLAAASGYVTDSGMRNQYNSHITTAASNLPPEDQARITTAMQTGQISQETLSKTSTSSSNSSQTTSQSSQTSQSTQSQAPKAQASAPAAQNQPKPAQPQPAPAQPTRATAAQVQQAQQQYQNAIQQVEQQRIERYNQESIARTEQVEIQKAEEARKAEETRKAEEKRRIDENIQASEDMRQEAMDNAKEVMEHINASIAEWEEKHKHTLTDEDKNVLLQEAAVDAVVESLEVDEHTDSFKTEIIKKLKKATSIGEIYEILVSALGSKVEEKFIDTLVSNGSSAKMMSFIRSRSGDSSLIKKIFLRTKSKTLQKELLSHMPKDDIMALLVAGKITDYSLVSQEDLFLYVKYLVLAGLSLDDFKKKYGDDLLGSDYMAKIFALFNKKELKSTPAPQTDDFNNYAANTVTEQRTVNSKQKPSKTFGAISNNMDGALIASNDEPFNLIQPKKKEEGAPIGMNDDVLTVGSAEWNLKYNHNNVQATAFTLASMEEDDEDDGVGNIMSTKGNFRGKKIKKKYNPGGFNKMV